MAQGGQQSPASSGESDPVLAALEAISGALVQRGKLTTEWWTTLIGAGLSTLLALIHIRGGAATHVVAIAAPALLAGMYAFARTMHKSALASVLRDVFPQAVAAGAASQGTSQKTPQTTPGASPSGGGATPGASTATGGAMASGSAPAAGATAQTDPEFVFEGIPPIGEADE